MQKPDLRIFILRREYIDPMKKFKHTNEELEQARRIAEKGKKASS